MPLEEKKMRSQLSNPITLLCLWRDLLSPSRRVLVDEVVDVHHDDRS